VAFADDLSCPLQKQVEANELETEIYPGDSDLEQRSPDIKIAESDTDSEQNCGILRDYDLYAQTVRTCRANCSRPGSQTVWRTSVGQQFRLGSTTLQFPSARSVSRSASVVCRRIAIGLLLAFVQTPDRSFHSKSAEPTLRVAARLSVPLLLTPVKNHTQVEESFRVAGVCGLMLSSRGQFYIYSYG